MHLQDISARYLPHLRMGLCVCSFGGVLKFVDVSLPIHVPCTDAKCIFYLPHLGLSGSLSHVQGSVASTEGGSRGEGSGRTGKDGGNSKLHVGYR